MKKISLIITFLLALQIYIYAQEADLIAGRWLTPGNEAIVQIEKNGGKYVGKILRIHPDGYMNGEAPKDVKNENPGLRSRSLEGIVLLSGISYNSRKEVWQISKVYEPDRGKYFEGYILMQSHNRLKLRGHVPGKKWLGETEIWKRQEDFDPPKSKQ